MMKCDRHFWGRDVCGATLREIVDRIGRVSFVCDGCARYNAGLCAECPMPRVGRSRRCQRHRVAHKKAFDPIHYKRRVETYLAWKRAKYRNDPEYRRQCIERASRNQRTGAQRTDIDRAYDRARKRKSRAKQANTRPSRAVA